MKGLLPDVATAEQRREQQEQGCEMKQTGVDPDHGRHQQPNRRDRREQEQEMTVARGHDVGEYLRPIRLLPTREGFV